MLTDQGTEFDGRAQEGFDNDDIFVEKTAAHAPWQNGSCERNGGIWKDVFARAFEESQPRNRLEVDELVDQVNVATVIWGETMDSHRTNMSLAVIHEYLD